MTNKKKSGKLCMLLFLGFAFLCTPLLMFQLQAMLLCLGELSISLLTVVTFFYRHIRGGSMVNQLIFTCK